MYDENNRRQPPPVHPTRFPVPMPSGFPSQSPELPPRREALAPTSLPPLSQQPELLSPPALPPRPSPTASPTISSSSSPFLNVPSPRLPPRPDASSSSLTLDTDLDSDSDSESFVAVPTPVQGSAVSAESLLIPKDEEGLSEVQLRELYDDEEIERFLHLFSTVRAQASYRGGLGLIRQQYVREVRVVDQDAAASQAHLAHAASASTPSLVQSAAGGSNSGVPRPPSEWDDTISQRIALVSSLVPTPQIRLNLFAEYRTSCCPCSQLLDPRYRNSRSVGLSKPRSDSTSRSSLILHLEPCRF